MNELFQRISEQFNALYRRAAEQLRSAVLHNGTRLAASSAACSLVDGHEAETDDDVPTQLESISSTLSASRRRQMMRRRQSVSAEMPEPEEDSLEWRAPFYPKSEEEMRALTNSLRQIVFLRELQPADLRRIAHAMHERMAEPNETVIREGSDGDNFYVIRRGRFVVTWQRPDGSVEVVRELEVNKLEGGECCAYFGELALLYNRPRSASVTEAGSSQGGALWVLDGEAFRRLVIRAGRQRRADQLRLLRGAPALSCLSASDLERLSDALTIQEFANGEAVFNKGDSADGMYFVIRGGARVVDSGGVALATIGPGGYFGEAAIINNKPRSATVFATAPKGDDENDDDNGEGERKATMAFLDAAAFERLLGSCVELMRHSMRQYRA